MYKSYFFFLIPILLISCTEGKAENIGYFSQDVIDTVSKVKETRLNTEHVIVSPVTIFNFKELKVEITSLALFPEANQENLILQDSILISADIGETIEGQTIKIISDDLEDIIVEQRYETSVTIMDEGPHCDLTEWIHYNSPWESLVNMGNNTFTGAEYSNEEREKFPEINIPDLVTQVKVQCSEEWAKRVMEIKSPTEYPSGVGISRYFLRISGKSKKGILITKIIAIDSPMGC